VQVGEIDAAFLEFDSSAVGGEPLRYGFWEAASAHIVVEVVSKPEVFDEHAKAEESLLAQILKSSATVRGGR
jgi:hypothetical protein